jgi:hypothetical protein
MQIRYTITCDLNFFYVVEIATGTRAKFFSKETANSVAAYLNSNVLRFTDSAAQEQRECRANQPAINTLADLKRYANHNNVWPAV